MAFRRACSYAADIKTPKDPAEYINAVATFKQDNVVVEKWLPDLIIDGDSFVVELSQQETKLFTAGKRAWFQLRCFISDTDVSASREEPIDVLPVLNDQILAAPTNG
jgi:hypothetical protein